MKYITHKFSKVGFESLCRKPWKALTNWWPDVTCKNCRRLKRNA